MYKRIVEWVWNPDSISETEDAITSMTGLARELTELSYPGSEDEYRGDWYIPAELSDEWEWLDWAMDRISNLGHRVEWTDGEARVQLIGGTEPDEKGRFFPFLLGYRSADWLRMNRKKVKA